MRLPFSLTAPVSRQHHQDQNKPLDTLKMQLGLEQLGFLEPGGDDVYTSTASDGLFNAMKDFQSATDLKVDGIANPGGPTEAALNDALSAAAPARPLITQPIGAADENTRISNEAGLAALDNRTDPGDLPFHMARELLSKDGEDAAPKVADLLRQTFAADPEMGARMRDDLAGLLQPSDMAKITEAAKVPAEIKESTTTKTQPMAQSTEDSNQDAPKPDPTEQEIKWQQEPTLFPEHGSTKIKTSGPIRLGANSQTLGLHGLKVIVKWHPLDEHGNIVPVWENGGGSNDEHEFPTTLPGKEESKVIEPPTDNAHGWRATIIIPPQSTTHGNAGKQHLNIYIPKSGDGLSKPNDQ